MIKEKQFALKLIFIYLGYNCYIQLLIHHDFFG